MPFYMKKYLEEDDKSAWEAVCVDFEDAEDYHAKHDEWLAAGWLDSTEDQFEDERATQVSKSAPPKKRGPKPKKKVEEPKVEEDVQEEVVK